LGVSAPEKLTQNTQIGSFRQKTPDLNDFIGGVKCAFSGCRLR
jgi:hypothetical protein